jgi:hypothetical protein
MKAGLHSSAPAQVNLTEGGLRERPDVITWWLDPMLASRVTAGAAQVIRPQQGKSKTGHGEVEA